MLKKMHRTRVIGAIAAACALTGSAFAQTPSAGKPEPSGHPAPATAQGANAETPQQFLAKRAGEYTRTIRFLGQQGAPAAPFTGRSKISVILDGHFIREENEDVVFGRPVSGMRIYGYNNATKHFEAVSMYTMSNAILMFAGTSSDGGKTVDYSSIPDSANAAGPALHMRMRQVNDDEFVITLSSVGPDGKETPFNETTYTRKK